MNLSTASSSLNRVREGESNILSLFFTLLYCSFLFFYLLSFTLWRFFSENGGFFSENPGNFRKNSFKTTQMKPPKVIYLAVADYVALCVSVYGSFRNLPCQITAGFAVTACVTLWRYLRSAGYFIRAGKCDLSDRPCKECAALVKIPYIRKTLRSLGFSFIGISPRRFAEMRFLRGLGRVEQRDLKR